MEVSHKSQSYILHWVEVFLLRAVLSFDSREERQHYGVTMCGCKFVSLSKGFDYFLS